MDDLLGLIKEDASDLGIRVSKGIDGDSCSKVNVLAVSNVVEIRALAVCEDDGWATVGCQGVFGVLIDDVERLGIRIYIGVTQLKQQEDGHLLSKKKGRGDFSLFFHSSKLVTLLTAWLLT